MLAEAAAEEAAAAAALGVRRVGAVEDLRCLEENLDSNVERRFALISQRANSGLAIGSNAGSTGKIGSSFLRMQRSCQVWNTPSWDSAASHVSMQQTRVATNHEATHPKRSMLPHCVT